MDYEAPQYSMSFDDDQGQVHTTSDTDMNALTKKVLQSLNPAPVIEELPDTYVLLPAGIIVDDKVVQDAEVQELNGEHEEKLAKSRLTNNPAKYINTLLQCGTVAIGDSPATPAVIESLIQGDLDMLMIGIRRATFGDIFEVFNVECPHCGTFNDMEMNLKDIPVKKLDDPTVREFVVPLRRGRKAKVQFPTGAVQTEIFKTQLTIPEMNHITLAACILSFTEADGSEVMCNGLAHVKKMSVPDRNTVEKFIVDNQPGPRYDQVVAPCHSCEGEVLVPLNVGILFREL